MNKNLLKLIAVYGTACFLACTAPQKAETENGVNAWHAPKCNVFPNPG